MSKFLRVAVMSTFVLTAGFTLAGQARLDATFPIPDGGVYAIAEQNGKVFIGGDFTMLRTATGGFGPLNITTAELSRATPNVQGDVFALAVDPSGAVYIGGSFTMVGTLSRPSIARILADGTVDPNWNPGVNGVVKTIVLSGTDLYIGGSFSTVQGAPRQNLAKLDTATGAVRAWAPQANGSVLTLGVSGTSVYAGGTFSTVNGTPRNRLAQVDSTSGVLSAWDPDADDEVRALAVSGGFVFVGGKFNFVGQANRAKVAKLDATTGFSEPWNPGVSGEQNIVYALAVDGSSIYVGGDFAIVGGAPRAGIAEVDTGTGNVTSWIGNTVLGADIFGIFLTPTLVAVAGEFSSLGGPPASTFALIDRTTGSTQPWNARPSGVGGRAIAISGSEVFVAGANIQSVGPSLRNRIAQLDLATKRVTAWNANLTGTSVLSLTADTGVLYVGGNFSSIGGQPRTNLAQLDSSNATATTWSPNSNGVISTIALGSGVVYVGGLFSSIGGAARSNIAAIDTIGTATSWQPDADNAVFTLATAGSTVLAGGNFSQIGGASRQFLAELDPATGAASAYQPAPNASVNTVAVAGGTAYVGGLFTSLNGSPRNYVAQIDLGTHQLTAWDPNPNSQVRAIAPSGQFVYIGGDFLTLKNVVARYYVAQIDAATGFPTAWDITASSPPPTSTLTASGLGVHFGGTGGTLNPLRTYAYIGSNSPAMADLNGPGGGTSFSNVFIEDGGSVPITDAAALTVIDADDNYVASATVTIDVRFDGPAETLTADTSGTNVVASFNLNTLSLTGDSKANVQKVLRTVRYNNASNTPNVTPRTILFNLNDGFDIGPTSVSTVSIVPTNDKPAANVQSVSTRPTIPKVITLTGSDLENDLLTYQIVTGPSNGVISGTPPNITYTPNTLPTPFAGFDSFTFKVNDGTVDSDPATVSVTVANDAPTAANVGPLNAHFNVAAQVTLQGNDINGDTLTYSIVTPPQHGLLTGIGANLVYTAFGYAGSDSFTYKVNDGVTDSNPATVSINVQNAVPTVNTQNLTVNPGVATPITLTGSDSDATDTLTYSIVAQPAVGTGIVTGTPPNVTFTAPPSFNGFTSFTFKTKDGVADSATGTVNLTVSGLAPIISSISPDSASVNASALTLTVNGLNFVALSKVRWNGTDLPTTYGSPLQLTAQVSAALLAASGRADVTVFSPAPGGGQSAVTNFFVYSGPIGTWIVSNTQDSGFGSLRFAMANCRANDRIIFDQVVFDLTNSDAATLINIRSPLPLLDDGNVTLDAEDRRVTVNGSAAGDSNGLTITSNSNKIFGLNIIGFTGSGIVLQGGAKNNQTGGSRLQPATGAGPNGQGLRISNCGAFGIQITGAGTSSNTVKGCWIGLDAGGMASQPNLAGVLIDGGATANTIGSTAAGEGNVFSGNSFEGLTISGAGTDGNIVIGNSVGLAAVGTVSRDIGSDGMGILNRQSLGNGSSGMFLSKGTQGSAMGGGNPGESNAVGSNGGSGIEVRALASRTNSSRSNRITHNSKGGIKLFDGSNDGITPPRLDDVTVLNRSGSRSLNRYSVTGTTDRDGDVELFADPADQGAIFLVKAQALGGRFSAEFDTDDAQTPNLTATLTDVNGNTSSFGIKKLPGAPANPSGGGTTPTVVDTDGDGVPDSMEQLLGTNASDASSKPAGSTSIELPFSKFAVTLKFKTGKDQIVLGGSIELPPGTPGKGTRAVYDIGGVSGDVTSGTPTFKLAVPKSGGPAKYTLTIKQKVSDKLADEGLSNADGSKSVTIAVYLYVGGQLYKKDLQSTYTVKSGTGTIK